MATIREMIDRYIQAATEFENRLQAVFGESRELRFSVEERVQFFKLLYWKKGYEFEIYARVDRREGRAGNIYDFLHGARVGPRGIVGNVFTGQYGFPDLPSIESSESSLWTAWYESFSEIPFSLSSEFSKLLEKNETTDVAEAIQITAKKPEPIYGNEARVRYMYGILRHKRLQAANPELAAEMKNIYSLEQYWKNQPRGTGYLNRTLVREWLRFCTPDEIRTVMHCAGGYWADLRSDMERMISTRKSTGVASVT